MYDLYIAINRITHNGPLQPIGMWQEGELEKEGGKGGNPITIEERSQGCSLEMETVKTRFGHPF